MHLYQKIGVSIATFIWGMMGVWCFHNYQQWLISDHIDHPETQLEILTDVALAPVNQDYSNNEMSHHSNTDTLPYGYWLKYEYLRNNGFTSNSYASCHCPTLHYLYRDGSKIQFDYGSYNSQWLKQRIQQYLRNATIIEKSKYLLANAHAQEPQKITRIVFTAINGEGKKLYLIAYYNGREQQLITAPTLQIALEFEQVYQRIIANNF